MYNKTYNQYVNDYLENLPKTLDFNLDIEFLNDGQREQDVVRAKKGYFSVYSLPDEEEKIISLHSGIFRLSRQESSLLLKFLPITTNEKE